MDFSMYSFFQNVIVPCIIHIGYIFRTYELRYILSFWAYELSKRAITGSEKSDKPEWMSVLLCGGIAGVVTWASIFPLGECFNLYSHVQLADYRFKMSSRRDSRLRISPPLLLQESIQTSQAYYNLLPHND